MHNTYVNHSWTDFKNLKWSIDYVTRGAQMIIHKRKLSMSCTACPLEIVVRETETNSSHSTALQTDTPMKDYYDVTISSQTSNKTYKIYPPM